MGGKRTAQGSGGADAAEDVCVNDELHTLIASLIAVVEGDRWLSADACWVFIGARSKRAFLERIACRPDFPKPARPRGCGSAWKRSEVDAWMDRQRINRAA
jgi:predicted DNA-binding transcriptional regulator AlpA